MRQYTSKGNVGGITPLDLDVFYGDLEQFKKYGNPEPKVEEQKETKEETKEENPPKGENASQEPPKPQEPQEPAKEDSFTDLIRQLLSLIGQIIRKLISY